MPPLTADDRRIGPSRGVVILLTVFLGGLVAYAGLEAFRGAYLQAGVLCALAVWMWLSIATTRVLVSPGRLGMSRYGRTVWEADLAGCDYTMVWRGMKGHAAAPHRMVVSDRQTGRRLGEIYPSALAKEDWAAILAHTGATV